jgi:Outer membrane protein beta-barrel domain
MRPMRIVNVVSLLLLTLLATRQPALAQTNDGGGVGFGVEALAAFPQISNLQSGLDAKTGYGFGLWVGGNRNGRVGFTGEFIYLVKNLEGSGTTAAKRYALEIPAVFHINFGPSYVVLGPAFTINVKDKLTGGLSGTNFAGADIGVMAGLGFEIARIGIEGRGNWGMKNISDDGATSTSKDFAFELLGKFRFN